MTGFACDHAASRKSLDTFVESTLIIGVQTDGKEFLLLGRCKRCDSTLAIEITTPRGHVVHGEMGTASPTESRCCCEGGRAPDDQQPAGSNPASPTYIRTEITPAGLRAFGEADERARAVEGQDVIERGESK